MMILSYEHMYVLRLRNRLSNLFVSVCMCACVCMCVCVCVVSLIKTDLQAVFFLIIHRHITKRNARTYQPTRGNSQEKLQLLKE
jgi:hypothetical protein